MTDPQPPKPVQFRDARVLITGGTAGVGLATAIKFAESGVPMIGLNGRNPERGEAARQAVLAAAPGCKVEFLAGDANRMDQAQALVAGMDAAFGGTDILVNSTVSGFPYPTLFHKLDPKDIEGMILTQIMAPVMMSRLVLDGMRDRGQGVIVNIASDAGKVTTPGESLIGGLMAAIMVFSRTLAMEAKRNGVRVNCVTPSIIEGTLTHGKVMANEFSGKLFGKATQMAQLGVVNAADMAELIVFLSSPAAAKLTGQAISLNGGISAA